MAATVASEAFAGQRYAFTGAESDAGPRGKRMSNAATRQALGGWAPKYASYDAFMRQHGARDWYSQQEGAAPKGMPHA